MKHLDSFPVLALIFSALLFCSVSVAGAQAVKIETAEFAYLKNQRKEELQQTLRDIGVIAAQDHLEFVGRQPRQRDLEPGTIDLISASAGPMVCREILQNLEDAICRKKTGEAKTACLTKVKQNHAPKYRECDKIRLSSN